MKARWILIIGMCAALNAALLQAQQLKDNEPELKGITITEHLGETVPFDLEFRDDADKPVKLSDYFGKEKPVLLVLSYYRCPMLCTLVLNGIANGAKEISLVPDKDYNIITVSIDPRETSVLAAEKKLRYVEAIGKPEAAQGWAFLTGAETASKQLADAVGFGYYYDEKKQEYAHPAAAFVITPEGKISRYLYGITFKPHDLKLSLLEAADGRTGSTIDRLILYCYHYDPSSKSYALFAGNVMRVGGVLTVLFLGIFLAGYWAKEKLA